MCVNLCVVLVCMLQRERERERETECVCVCICFLSENQYVCFNVYDSVHMFEGASFIYRRCHSKLSYISGDRWINAHGAQTGEAE